MSLQQITANDILNLPANTVSNTQLVAGSVENYLSSQGNFITYRNRIQNGEMAVNQRATTSYNVSLSGSSAGSNFLGVDRWSYYFYNVSTTFNAGVNVKQTADHPIKGSNGNCLEIICTTAATPANNVDFFTMTHGIESQNITDIFSGSSALPMTLSFWVKSNKTGTYTVELRDVQSGAGNYYILVTYTIINSGVWEKKVINIPAPTFSSMPNNVSQGLYIQFSYASGLTSTYQPLVANSVGAWSNAYGTNGAAVTTQANLFSNVGNYHRLTDVQLESGSTATPFERRPYAVELQLCQRYLQTFGKLGASQTLCAGVNYPRLGSGAPYQNYAYGAGTSLQSTMRISPSLTVTGNIGGYTITNMATSDGYIVYANNFTTVLDSSGPTWFALRLQNPAGQFNQYATIHATDFDGTGMLILTAEI